MCTLLEKFWPISNYDIQALVDEELSPARARVVLSFLEKDPDAARFYLRLQRQKKTLQLWWAEEYGPLKQTARQMEKAG